MSILFTFLLCGFVIVWSLLGLVVPPSIGFDFGGFAVCVVLYLICKALLKLEN